MNKLSVEINKNIELMGVLSFLSCYGFRLRTLLGRYPEPSTELFLKAQQWFSEQREETVVEKFDTLTSGDFVFDAVIDLFLTPGLFHSNPLFSPHVLQRCSHRSLLDQVVSRLAEFCKKSKFDTYLEKNSEQYLWATNKVKDLTEGKKIVQKIEEYTGMYCDFYTIIPAPLIIGNYGLTYEVDNRVHNFAVICPVSLDKLFFGDYHHIFMTSIHEFLHFYINRLTEKYLTEENEQELSFLADENMKRMGYISAASVINETIIDAICHRLEYFEFGETLAESSLMRKREAGFKYIGQVCSLLKTYEAERARYKTVACIYESLIKLFQ